MNMGRMNLLMRRLKDNRTIIRVVIDSFKSKLQKNEGRDGFESTMMKGWTNDAAEVLLPQTWEILSNELKKFLTMLGIKILYVFLID